MLRAPALVLSLMALGASSGPAQERTRIEIQADGWRLIGDFVAPGPGRTPAVLLLNGAARDRRAYIALAQELAARGIAPLRLDLRAEGESTNLGRFEPGVTTALLEGSERDVAAALAWLRSQSRVDGTRIGVLGASYSGEAMAAAARDGARAQAYVALSPGGFSDTSARAIDASGTAWWFIASRDERFAHAVVEGIPAISRTARVTLVAGNAHASDILSPHAVLNGEIADWFAARLRGYVPPALWGDLPHGPHPTGFRTIHVPDGDGGVRVDLWYPALTAGTQMRLADYLRESTDARDAAAGFPDDASLEPTLARMIAGDDAQVPAPAVARMLSSPMDATRDAAPGHGRFPLALWTPRYGTAVMQAVMSEFLASHGFVVAFARRADEAAKLTFELEGRDEKVRELEARVRDMQIAIDAVAHESEVDASRIAVIAWSYTGEMATQLQLREPRIALVAGLSTTLVNDWVFQDPASLDELDPARLTAVYAILSQPRPEPPPLLRRLANSYYVEFPDTAHGSFNAVEGHAPALFGITAVQRWSASGFASSRGYEAAAQIVLRLLRRHLPSPAAPLLRTSELVAGLESRAVAVIRPIR